MALRAAGVVSPALSCLAFERVVICEGWLLAADASAVAKAVEALLAALLMDALPASTSLRAASYFLLNSSRRCQNVAMSEMCLLIRVFNSFMFFPK